MCTLYIIIENNYKKLKSCFVTYIFIYGHTKKHLPINTDLMIYIRRF